MPSQQELKKLELGLLEDVSRARKQSTQTASAIGVTAPRSFDPRAVRFKGRALGAAQISQSRTAVNDAIKNLVKQSGITDVKQRGAFQARMKAQLTNTRMEILRKTIELKKELTSRKMDAAKQQALLKAFGNIVGNITETAVGNIGVGGSTVGQVAVPTQALGDSPLEQFSSAPSKSLADLPTPFQDEGPTSSPSLSQGGKPGRFI